MDLSSFALVTLVLALCQLPVARAGKMPFLLKNYAERSSETLQLNICLKCYVNSAKSQNCQALTARTVRICFRKVMLLDSISNDCSIGL